MAADEISFSGVAEVQSVTRVNGYEHKYFQRDRQMQQLLGPLALREHLTKCTFMSDISICKTVFTTDLPMMFHTPTDRPDFIM